MPAASRPRRNVVPPKPIYVPEVAREELEDDLSDSDDDGECATDLAPESGDEPDDGTGDEDDEYEKGSFVVSDHSSHASDAAASDPDYEEETESSSAASVESDDDMDVDVVDTEPSFLAARKNETTSDLAALFQQKLRAAGAKQARVVRARNCFHILLIGSARLGPAEFGQLCNLPFKEKLAIVDAILDDSACDPEAPALHRAYLALYDSEFERD